MQRSIFQQPLRSSVKLANKSIYLIAKYTAQPKDPSQTSRAGYMKNPDNIRYDEQVYVTRGLKARDQQHHVILNLTEEKVEKDTFKSGQSFETMFKHFYDGYAEYIDQSVNLLNEVDS